MRVPSRDGELPSSLLRYGELVPAQEAAGNEGEADLQPGVGRGAWERNQCHQVAVRAGPGLLTPSTLFRMVIIVKKKKKNSFQLHP